MAAQMKLALPPISKILVKLCLFAHILLVSIAFLGFAPGVGFICQKSCLVIILHLQGFYLYINLLFFGLLLLHLHIPTHPETVHLALATNLVSTTHNAVVIIVITTTIIIAR